MHICRNWSLSIVLLGIFAVLAAGQSIAGYRVMSNDLRQHAQPTITYFQYLGTGMCWESLAENWESEFLEMGAFVWLTSFLIRRVHLNPEVPTEMMMRPTRRPGQTRLGHRRAHRERTRQSSAR